MSTHILYSDDDVQIAIGYIVRPQELYLEVLIQYDGEERVAEDFCIMPVERIMANTPYAQVSSAMMVPFVELMSETRGAFHEYTNIKITGAWDAADKTRLFGQLVTEAYERKPFHNGPVIWKIGGELTTVRKNNDAKT